MAVKPGEEITKGQLFDLDHEGNPHRVRVIRVSKGQTRSYLTLQFLPLRDNEAELMLGEDDFRALATPVAAG